MPGIDGVGVVGEGVGEADGARVVGEGVGATVGVFVDGAGVHCCSSTKTGHACPKIRNDCRPASPLFSGWPKQQ